MNTTGNNTTSLVSHEDQQGINLSFQNATEDLLPKGAPVTIDSTGKAKLATGADFVCGVVTVPAKGTVGLYSGPPRVTVITKFRSVTVGKAVGVVADGAKLEAVAVEAGVVTYKTLATSGAIPVGIAIKGGADATDITVGIL
jgi:hypothetical protein